MCIRDSDISSDYAILIDLENNTVLASKKGDEKMYPASMTKMMTLIVAAEHAEHLDDTFEMTTAITDPLFLENASVAGFLNGEQVTLRDLMYGPVSYTHLDVYKRQGYRRSLFAVKQRRCVFSDMLPSVYESVTERTSNPQCASMAVSFSGEWYFSRCV